MSNSRSSVPSVPLYPILAVSFVGTLGFSIVIPFLVFMVTRLGGNALIYGLMGSTYSAFQLIGAPLLGRWSDSLGRKKILLLSQIGMLVSWLIFLGALFLPLKRLIAVDSELLGSFVITLPLLVIFLARAADGLTGGNVSVANAYLADITDESTRSANFGKMAASTNLGFVLGPAIAGLLAGTALGEVAPVLAAVTISVLATLIIAFKLPESSLCVLERDPERPGLRKTFGFEHKECFKMEGAARLSLRQLFELRGVPVMLAIYFLVMLGFSFFYVGFPAHASGTLEWSVAQTGIFFTVLSVLMVLVQGPLLGALSGRLSDVTLIVGGSLTLALGFALFSSPATWTLVLGVVLLALGNGLMWPSVLSAMSRVAGEKHQGAVQGIAGSVGATASILGLTTGGVLYATLGGRVFLWAGAIIFLVFLLTLPMLASRSRPQF